jgi:hypothetical protein
MAHWRKFTAAFLFVLIPSATSAQTDAGVPAVAVILPAGPYPPNADQLNDRLKANDYLGLRDLIWQSRDGTIINENMNWERDQVLAGSSAFVSVLYAMDLWRAGNSGYLNDRASLELKKSALAQLTYAYFLTFLDGVKCGDASAPVIRRQSLTSKFSNFDLMEIWKAFFRLIPDDRKQVVLAAGALERKTRSLRQNDEFLCSGGNADRSNLSAALKTYLDTHDSLPNGTVEIPIAPPADYQVKFLPESEWAPKQKQLGDWATLQDKALIPFFTWLKDQH